MTVHASERVSARVLDKETQTKLAAKLAANEQEAVSFFGLSVVTLMRAASGLQVQSATVQAIKAKLAEVA